MTILLRAGLLYLVSDNTISLPVALDFGTLGFVVALTIAAGLILGLLPAMRITRTQPTPGCARAGASPDRLRGCG